MASEPSGQRYLAPWEDSPGKGSRDSVMQDATFWGRENLSKYLLENNGDPLGVLDPAAVSRFLDPINARKAELAARDPYLNYGAEPGYTPRDPYLNYGAEPELAQYMKDGQAFTEFSAPQLQAYLDRQRNDYIAAGNRGNDAMWMPQFIEVGGRQFVAYGDRNSGKGGLLDKITARIEPMMALSGFALAGMAASAFAAEAAAAAIAAETAAGGGSLLGTVGLEAGVGASNAWTLSGAIDKALDPTNLLTSAAKNAVGQFVSTGNISPEGLIAGVAGNAVGGVAGGAVGDATGSGIIGGIAGSVVGSAAGSAINNALTDEPDAPGGGTTGGGTTTGTGTTGTGSTPPVVNDVPMGFDLALSPYQPIYQRA